MAHDLFARYVWLMDTLRRYGRITGRELNRRWAESPFSDGRSLPRRTFYNYRQALQQLFNVNIEYNPATFEYYIDNKDEKNDSVTDWLLNTTATSNVLSEARDISGRIFLEDVPSAREYLHVVIDALKMNRAIRFDYHPYTRSNPTRNIVLEPYFLKIFRQRWYITGRNVADSKVKTYALDRMTDAILLDTTFKMPDDFDAEAYCSASFGVIFNMGTIEHVVIRVEPRQAKYFRALPLHQSQRETIYDSFSLLHFDIRITPDFVEELLSYGPKITVVEPRSLRLTMIERLRETLAGYDELENIASEPQSTIY
ncbi:MAG: WYL domain-containing protein [Muribaculaceae bacterium]|nr:WYL domain-containing protein [Muribaculaceae bacterium]